MMLVLFIAMGLVEILLVVGYTCLHLRLVRAECLLKKVKDDVHEILVEMDVE